MSDDHCDDCGEPVVDALARTVRLGVDGETVDEQRLCPDCFAAWLSRYEAEMGAPADDGDREIIVD
jgi:hypothetical protein